jgi:hypothetical protein
MSTTTKAATCTCADCKHWSNQAKASEGECRRHAPQALVFVIDAKTKFESRFPATQAGDWCGDFEKR